MSEELKPCPMCGGEVLIGGIAGYDTPWFTGNCMADGCGFTADGGRTYDEVVPLVNRQPYVDALRARIAELEKAVANYKADAEHFMAETNNAQYLLSMVPYEFLRNIRDHGGFTVEAVQCRAFLDEVEARRQRKLAKMGALAELIRTA